MTKAAHHLDVLGARLASYSGKKIPTIQAEAWMDLAQAARDLRTEPAAGGFRSVAASGKGLFKWDNPFAPGKKAPDFTAPTQYGPFHLRSRAGKWVILDFCAQWCLPCGNMAERQQPLVDFLRANGVPIEYVTVLLENATQAPASDFASASWALRYGINSPVVHTGGLPAWRDLLYQHFAFYSASAIQGYALLYPVVVVIDPNQRIRQIFLGEQSPELLLMAMGRDDLTFPGGTAPTVRFDLTGYQTDISYGATTGTWNGISFDFVAPSSGNTPSGAVARHVNERDGYVLTATTGFGIFENPEFPSPLDSSKPFALDVSALSWDSAGAGFLLPRRAKVRYLSFDFQEYTFPLDVSVDENGKISAGPIIPGDAGVPANVDLWVAELSLSWLRPEPLAQITHILTDLPSLKLKKKPEAVLRSYLQRAKAGLAPPRVRQDRHQPAHALHQSPEELSRSS